MKNLSKMEEDHPFSTINYKRLKSLSRDIRFLTSTEFAQKQIDAQNVSNHAQYRTIQNQRSKSKNGPFKKSPSSASKYQTLNLATKKRSIPSASQTAILQNYKSISFGHLNSSRPQSTKRLSVTSKSMSTKGMDKSTLENINKKTKKENSKGEERKRVFLNYVT